ncbi:MAG TPA: tetratricopeptide repeat protein [Puia sp.]|jgi:tetratricopeptide (TPR) repeat protein|nr:tetratricopeptide repeat protein [Puia sp.]
MDSIELIDDYFKGLLTGEQQKQVEQRILSDPSFAEDLAFYLSANEAVRQQLADDKKAWFKELYERSKTSAVPRKSPVRPLYVLATAAAIMAIVLGGWWLFFRHPSPRQLADDYVSAKLMTLGVRMSSTRDTMQTAIERYNSNDLPAAAALFESFLQHHPDDEYAAQYSGIVYLRLKQYDKALHYFQQLAADTTLYYNPALFYQSLTLMERRLPGDDEKAKAMLQEVVNRRLGGNEDAQQLLSKW